MICRKVDQFMHEPLTEPLHLARTVVSMRHHGEIRIHTGIPAAVPLYAVPRIIVFNIITLAGRTYKCTRTACQTGLIQFVPQPGAEPLI